MDFFLVIKTRAAGTQTRGFPTAAEAEAHAREEMRAHDLNTRHCEVWRKDSAGDDALLVEFHRQGSRRIERRPDVKLRLDARSTRRFRLSPLAARLTA